jgi:hypothetical protein
LCFLGPHQVRQGQELDPQPVRDLDRRPPRPDLGERGDPAEDGHDVDSQAVGVRVGGPEVQGVAAAQVVPVRGRDGDAGRPQLGQRRRQPGQVLRVGEYVQVGVPAKLRRAV